MISHGVECDLYYGHFDCFSCSIRRSRWAYNNQYVFAAEFTVISELTDQWPYNRVPQMNFPEEIVSADPIYDMPEIINLLFEIGIWAKILGPKIYRNPLLIKVGFGCVILGRFGAHHSGTSCTITMKAERGRVKFGSNK